MEKLICKIEGHPELTFPVTLNSSGNAQLVAGFVEKVRLHGINCYLEHDVLNGEVFYVPARVYSIPNKDELNQPPQAGMVFLNEAYNQVGFIYGKTQRTQDVPQIGTAPVDKLAQLGKLLWENSNSSYKPGLFKMTVELA